MNYELIHDITAADIAVRVRASSLSLLFKYGAEALMSEMVDDISSIRNFISKNGVIEGKDLTLLYFDFLNEFLFFKDAENLLLLPLEIEVLCKEGLFECVYALGGEKIDRDIHKFRVDIKAVTLHGLQIYEKEGLFAAESVFDV